MKKNEGRKLNSFNKHRWIIFQKILFTSNTNFTLNRFSIIILNFNDTKIISCVKNLQLREEKNDRFQIAQAKFSTWFWSLWKSNGYKNSGTPDNWSCERCKSMKLSSKFRLARASACSTWLSSILYLKKESTNWFVCFFVFIRIEFGKKLLLKRKKKILESTFWYEEKTN